MTYNIWNYNKPWRARRALLAALIREYKPDVVALQETRHDFRYERGRGQGEQLADLSGYHATSAVAQVYLPVLRVDEGLTILTREPPARVLRRELTVRLSDRLDHNRRLVLGVVLRSGNGEVHVYDTHFSLSSEMRLSNARETAAFVRQEAGDALAVLMGDLNATPDSAPIRHLTGGQPGDGGFVDCWTAVHGDEPGFTDPSWAPAKRIDYVLARNLPDGVVSAQVIGTEPTDGVYPSDHAGIVVDVEV